MVVSFPDAALRRGLRGFVWLALASVGGATGTHAQVEATPRLAGSVLVADSAAPGVTVVLHHLTEGSQGELDSVRAAADGAFSFDLPSVPDPARSDVFFASYRHDGVLYFGPMITEAVQLDSLYEIHAFDTLMAPVGGSAAALESRSLFLEPEPQGGWRATDVLQIRNDLDRTVVARPDGRTWSYPLPEGARDVMAGEGEMSVDAATFEDGAFVVRAALPPGERLFVVRYRLDADYASIPTPGVTEALDVLIREPAPPLEIESLELVDRIQLESGSTYQRYSAVDFALPFVELIESEEGRPPPVQWMAVILAMMLTAGGLLALRSGAGPAASTGGGDASATGPSRSDLLMQVARLDEEHAARTQPNAAESRAYERSRAELLRRIRSLR